MTFKPENCATFESLFKEVYPLISTFPGCRSVHLLNGTDLPIIFFTYSVWDTEADLENYRNSELFINTWKRTKILFQEKAEAWSLTLNHPI